MNISNETIINNQTSVKVGHKHYVTNSKGYLINFYDWDKDFTYKVAELDHLKLTKPHWAAINFLRDFYSEYEVPPTPHLVIKSVGKKINSFGCTNHDVKRMFPLGGCKQACRLAGLPLHHCNAC